MPSSNIASYDVSRAVIAEQHRDMPLHSRSLPSDVINPLFSFYFYPIE
jgi:hypothetical protein